MPLPFLAALPIVAWFRGNWLAALIAIGAVLIILGGVYYKGRMDERLAGVESAAKETTENYETERKNKRVIRDSDFGAVLDLNDRLYRQQHK